MQTNDKTMKLKEFGADMDEIKQALMFGPCYVIVMCGMGCSCYVRRSDEKSPLEELFIHSDDWVLDDTLNNVDDFTKGYMYINKQLICNN